jgi:hypothetical protein
MPMLTPKIRVRTTYIGCQISLNGMLYLPEPSRISSIERQQPMILQQPVTSKVLQTIGFALENNNFKVCFD